MLHESAIWIVGNPDVGVVSVNARYGVNKVHPQGVKKPLTS